MASFYSYCERDDLVASFYSYFAQDDLVVADVYKPAAYIDDDYSLLAVVAYYARAVL